MDSHWWWCVVLVLVESTTIPSLLVVTIRSSNIFLSSHILWSLARWRGLRRGRGAGGPWQGEARQHFSFPEVLRKALRPYPSLLLPSCGRVDRWGHGATGTRHNCGAGDGGAHHAKRPSRSPKLGIPKEYQKGGPPGSARVNS